MPSRRKCSTLMSFWYYQRDPDARKSDTDEEHRHSFLRITRSNTKAPNPTFRSLGLILFTSAVAWLILSSASREGLVRAVKLSTQQAVANDGSRSKGISILHLIDKPTTEALMDRWFLRSHYAFSKAPPHLVSRAVMWGQGFPGWDDSMSIVENVENYFGRRDAFDAVLAYYNNDQHLRLGRNDTAYYYELADLAKHTVLIDRPHEMRDQRRAAFYDKSGAKLCLSPYPNEVMDYKFFMPWTMMVHQPHFVDRDLFFHPIQQVSGAGVVEAPRPIDVTLPGSFDPAYYPLRRRLAHLIWDKKMRGQVRKHPGYPDTLPEERRKARNVSGVALEQQLVDYSNTLGSAKICLITSSRWGYSLQKYTEAAAAGCLILGNIPLDRSSEFRKFVIEIRNDMTDAQLVDTVNHWLSPIHDEERIKTAKKGQDWALGLVEGKRGFTLETYVEDVVRWVNMIKDGHRGLILPYEWEPLRTPLPNDG